MNWYDRMLFHIKKARHVEESFMKKSYYVLREMSHFSVYQLSKMIQKAEFKGGIKHKCLFNPNQFDGGHCRLCHLAAGREQNQEILQKRIRSES